MNTVDLLGYSLQNAFGILGQVAADLTQEQADWTPPGTANPIGALYWHCVSSVDQIVRQWCCGSPPLAEADGWRDRVLGDSAADAGEETVEQMRAARADLPALHEYAAAVQQDVQGWLGSLTPADVECVMNTPIGDLNLGQLLETFVIWHVNAHCGEISALKGCQGAKGYPF